MKTFVIVLLSLTLVFALPINDTNLENDGSDGWFVPQKDGSLKWMTEKEGQLKKRTLTMSRKQSKEAKVQFYLYTQNNPDKPSEVFIDDLESLVWSGFNINHETRIIIHGWQNNYKSDVNTLIRDAFFYVGEFNVICVDWSDKADSYNYYTAANAVSAVGQQVAKFIDFLRDEANMESKSLKVIGHSLGAHVAGFAGKLIQGEQINTIIGLDIAFPLFKYDDCEQRLCSTDAVYVESIHTNGRLLGFIQPIGQTAFYPNGGRTQPGCGLDITGTCSHSRAYMYYAEAVKKMFFGVLCDDWKTAEKKECQLSGSEFVTGFDSGDNHAVLEGIFYSPVNKQPPYCTLYSYS